MTTQPKDAAAGLVGKIVETLSEGGLSKDSFVSVVDGGLLIDPSVFDYLTAGSDSGSGSDPFGGGGSDPFGDDGDSDDFGDGSSSSTPTAPTLTAEQLNHQREVSGILNVIPSPGTAWSDSGRNVDQLYGDWLSTARVPEIPLGPTQQTALKKAEATVDKYGADYFRYKAGYQNAASAVAAAKLSGADVIRINHLKDVEQDQLQLFESVGHKQEFEAALATQENLAQSGYSGLMSQLKSNYQTVKSNHLDGNGDHFLPVNLVPESFAGDDSFWNQHSFAQKETSQYSSLHSQQWSAGATIPLEGFFWVGGGTSGTKRSYVQDIAVNDFKVSFELARVLIDRRAWFDPMLLESRSWWWPDSTQANPVGSSTLFSDGSPPLSNQGRWVLTPQEVLLARNLTVEVQTSNTHTSDQFSQIHAEASAGFLIFHLGGASYTKTDHTHTHTFTASGDTISAPSMQIIGFVCSVMPQEPHPFLSRLPQGGGA